MDFTARTILQSSQQGDDTSIQQVSIIVETHQVTVEHPAELQPQSEPVIIKWNQCLCNKLLQSVITDEDCLIICARVTFPLSMHKSSVCIISELQYKWSVSKQAEGVNRHLLVLQS